MGLSVEELAHFHREGFVVAKSVLPAAVIAAVAVANGECRSAAFQPPPSPHPPPPVSNLGGWSFLERTVEWNVGVGVPRDGERVQRTHSVRLG